VSFQTQLDAPSTYRPLPRSAAEAEEAIASAAGTSRVAGVASLRERYWLVAGSERGHDYMGNRAAQRADGEELVRLAEAAADEALRADASWRRADWLFRVGRYDESVRVAEAGLTAAALAGRRDLRGACLRPGASSLACSGRLDEAALWAHEASTIAAETGDLQAEAAARSQVGAIAILRGRPDQAAEVLTAAASAWRATGDRRELVRTLNNLALASHMQGHLKQAQESIVEAADLAETLADDGLASNVLATLGQVELAMGMPHRALGRFGASRVMADRAGDPRVQAAVSVLEARARMALDEPGQTIPQLKEATRRLAAIGAHDLLAEATHTLADALLATGKTAEASGALAAWRNVGTEDPRTLVRCAEAEIAAGRTASASGFVQRASQLLAGDRPSPWGEPDPTLWWRLARAALVTGDRDLAVELSERGDRDARAQGLELDESAREPFLLALHRRRSLLIGRGVDSTEPASRSIRPDEVRLLPRPS
jgi:tetratricopeptide (TPR) repeat protein